eukprot:ctg_1456.g505
MGALSVTPSVPTLAGASPSGGTALAHSACGAAVLARVPPQICQLGDMARGGGTRLWQACAQGERTYVVGDRLGRRPHDALLRLPAHRLVPQGGSGGDTAVGGRRAHSWRGGHCTDSRRGDHLLHPVGAGGIVGHRRRRPLAARCDPYADVAGRETRSRIRGVLCGAARRAGMPHHHRLLLRAGAGGFVASTDRRGDAAATGARAPHFPLGCVEGRRRPALRVPDRQPDAVGAAAVRYATLSHPSRRYRRLRAGGRASHSAGRTGDVGVWRRRAGQRSFRAGLRLRGAGQSGGSVVVHAAGNGRQPIPPVGVPVGGRVSERGRPALRRGVGAGGAGDDGGLQTSRSV